MAHLNYENIAKATMIGCDHLGIDYNKIMVDIFREDSPMIGWCCGDKDQQLIEINQQLRGNDWVEVFAHELIHAKQYQRGELEDGKKGTMYWNGDAHIVLPNMTHEAYMALPWEREAYLGQHALYQYIINDYWWQ